MAAGGKHLNKKSRRTVRRLEKSKKVRRDFDWKRDGVKILILLVFCIVMLSPLKSCVISDKEYIGREKAQELVLQDARVQEKKAEGLTTDMIELDGRSCYKIEFNKDEKEYKYIITADDGSIIASKINDKE